MKTLIAFTLGVSAGALVVLAFWHQAESMSGSQLNYWGSQGRGNAIIAAIQEFKLKNARLPNCIEELSNLGYPIAPPKSGAKAWRYAVLGEHFELSFGTEQNYPVAFWSSKEKWWQVDQ